MSLILTTEQRRTFLFFRLKKSHFPVCIRQLANEYDVSVKTIRRDIKHFSEALGASYFLLNSKVYFDASQPQKIEIQGQWFSRQEIQSIFVIHQILEQLSPGSLKEQLEPFKERLGQMMQGQNALETLAEKVRIIEISDRKISEEIFNLLSQSLMENRQVEIQFWNRYRDEKTKRIVSPIRLIRYKDNWMLDAYCHLRKALRSFSLEVINDVVVTDYRAVKVPKDQARQHYESSYGVYAGKANKVAILKFTEYASRWVKYENWHPQQIGQWNLDQSYQLQIPYNQDDELIQDILKHANQVEVLAPAELREKILKKLKRTLDVYSGTGFVPGG